MEDEGRRNLKDAVALLPTPTASTARVHESEVGGTRPSGSKRAVSLGSVVKHKLLPTPAAGNPNDGEDPEQWMARHERHATKSEDPTRAGMPLSVAVRLMPPPTARDQKGSDMPNRDGGPSLAQWAKELPTPTAGDSRGSRNSTATRYRTPPTGVHAGDTLTDAVTKISGATTDLQSEDMSEHSDGQLRLL